MEALLIIAFFAAFSGLIVSLAALYKMIFSKNN